MQRNTRKYVTNLINANRENIRQVGLNAYYLNVLASRNIPVNTSFVINTNAFDDMIIANSLVDRIIGLIDQINRENPKTIKKASKEIQKFISHAEIPTNILKEIYEAYKNLSGFSRNFVELQTSPINEELDETNYQRVRTKKSNIYSEEQLREGIIYLWQSLFSEKAIYAREIKNYSGELSIAIVVEKIAPAEASGIVYSFDTTDNNSALIEVQAMYGMNYDDHTDETIPDNYKISKKNLEIIEKNIITQEWMKVIGGRLKESMFRKIKVSNTWKKKQKIDNNTIKNIAYIATVSEEIFEKPVELLWAKEADKIYVTEIRFVKPLHLFEEDYLEKPITLALQAKIEEKTQSSKTAITISNKPKYKPNYTLSHIELQKRQESDLSKLNLIASGKGNNKGLVWGIVKVIDEMLDLTDINEKNILILNKDLTLQKDDLKDMKFSGIITSGKYIDPNIPTISYVANSENLFRENEVITIDSNTGKIYLGIGKEGENKKVIVDQDTGKVSNLSDAELKKNKIVIPLQEPIDTITETYIILNENISLPEKNTNIDGGYITDLTSIPDFAKSLDTKPLIIELSLNITIESEKQFYEDLKILHKYRNQDNFRNIWLSLKNIRHIENLIEGKKILLTAKFRRSSTFKILVTFDNLTAIFSSDDIMKNGIDGIIIDIPSLMTEMFGKFDDKYFTENAFENSINTILFTANKYNTKVWVKGDLSKKFIIELVHKGIFAFIISPEKLHETKKIIAANEVTKLVKRSKKNWYCKD